MPIIELPCSNQTGFGVLFDIPQLADDIGDEIGHHHLGRPPFISKSS